MLIKFLKIIDSKFKKETPEISWTVTTPVTIITLYIASTFLYNFLSGYYEAITYIGPQTFFLLSIFFMKFVKGKTFEDMGLGRKNLTQNLLLSLSLILAIYCGTLVFAFGIKYINEIYPFVPPHVAFFRNRPLNFDGIFVFCLIIYAPICEEVIFRGILFPALMKEMNLFWSVALSSLIFMSAHLRFHPGALMLGIFTPFIYLATRSIIPTIFVHAACNALGLLLPHFSPFMFYFLSFLFK